jgi:protein ImuA
MSISKAPTALRLVRANENFARNESRVPQTFETVRAALSPAPLTEIMPASPGDHAAALGFALAWAVATAQDSVIFWAAAERDFFEDGLPDAEGLAQYGVSLDRLLMARANSQIDVLWAAEQALGTPETIALCAISPSKKPLSLTATRRLLLTAERHKTRCILLRLDAAGASGAWSRWQVRAAPSAGEGRELGAPSFNAHLLRSRAGPSGMSFNLNWDSVNHAFRPTSAAMDGAVAAAPAGRPADARSAA